jgi:hypothetical protein
MLREDLFPELEPETRVPEEKPYRLRITPDDINLSRFKEVGFSYFISVYGRTADLEVANSWLSDKVEVRAQITVDGEPKLVGPISHIYKPFLGVNFTRISVSKGNQKYKLVPLDKYAHYLPKEVTYLEETTDGLEEISVADLEDLSEKIKHSQIHCRFCECMLLTTTAAIKEVKLNDGYFVSTRGIRYYLFDDSAVLKGEEHNDG